MMEEGPTAIFAVNDEIAVGAIHAAQDLGKRVPEEISVIGFDNIPLATQVRPLLSTVAVPMYDIGAVAMRLLTKYMNGEPSRITKWCWNTAWNCATPPNLKRHLIACSLGEKTEENSL